MRIWRIYRTLFLLIIWTYVVLGYNYLLLDQCQSPYQWNLRAKAICSVSSANYSCLYNVEQKKYNESCGLNADYVKPGYRYVIKGTGRANGNCSHSRYQPIKLWSNRSSECEFLKNKCNEIGQVIFRNRLSTKDRSCRCDYTNGFDFVVQPINVCYCIPSEEDCSCYRKMCSPGNKLTKDYVCHSNLKDVTGGRCSIIKTRKPSITSSSTSQPILADSDKHMEPHIIQIVSLVLTLLSIFIILLGILTIYKGSCKTIRITNPIKDDHPFNIIAATKTFLIEEMDIDKMLNKLYDKQLFDIIEKNSFLPRKEKAKIICEHLEKQPPNIIDTIYQILGETKQDYLRKRLIVSEQIFRYKHEKTLKDRISEHYDGIVECLTGPGRLEKIISVLTERSDLQQNVDAVCRKVYNNERKKISKIIKLVQKDGLHSMLQFVYALLIVDEETFVITLIADSG